MPDALRKPTTGELRSRPHVPTEGATNTPVEMDVLLSREALSPAGAADRRHYGRHRADRGHTLRARLRDGLSDPMARNSLHLTTATAMLSAVGFVFWVVAARLFSVDSVGQTSALISVLTALSVLASLGWPQLATRDGGRAADRRTIIRNAALGAAAAAVLGLALIIGVPGHLGVPFDLDGKHTAVTVVLDVVFVAASSIDSTFQGVLIARRSARLILRVVLLAVIVRLIGLAGGAAVSTSPEVLLAVNVVSAVASAASSWGYVHAGHRFEKVLPLAATTARSFWRESVVIGSPAVIATLPGAVIATIVLRALGEQAAAYFGVAIALATAIRLVPSVMSQTLLAEVGGGADGRAALSRALRLALPTTYLVCALACVASPLVLRAYGSSYAEHAEVVFILLAIGGAVAGLNYLLDGYLLATRHSAAYAAVNTFGTVNIIGWATLGTHFGLDGVGWGYIIADIIYSVISLTAIKIVRRRDHARADRTLMPHQQLASLHQASSTGHRI